MWSKYHILVTKWHREAQGQFRTLARCRGEGTRRQARDNLRGHLPADGFALGGGDRTEFDLLVEIGLESSLRLRAERFALIFRAEALLRTLA